MSVRLLTKNEAKHQKKGCRVVYSKKFDTYFCQGCNVWLEKACGWKRCLYCSSRPAKPNSE